MSHSIPDARAVALRTELGTVLITGDYKFDQTPVDGTPGRRLAARRARARGRAAASAATRPTPTAPASRPRSRASARRCSRSSPAARAGSSSPRFASNVHRVQQVIDAADAARPPGRAGRALDAQELQHRLQPRASPTRPTGCFIQPREIEDFPDEKVVVISTGSQGEPLSALRRMAHNDHRDVELHSGDTVIFSATPIPGNERSVNETIDRIFEIGAQVVTAADAPIHASGHGWQEELKLMLNLTKPRTCCPFHGDHKRLRLHAELAESVGIEPERIFTGPQRAAARDRRDGRPLRRGRPRRHDLRRRRRHRRARRRRAARPPRRSPPTASSSSSRRSPPTTARRSRRPGGDLPRRPVRRGGRRPASTSSRDVVEDTLDDAAADEDPRDRRCSRRTCTTTSPSSSTRSSAAARWCCRSSSRSDGCAVAVTAQGREMPDSRDRRRGDHLRRERIGRIRALGRASACARSERELERGFSELGRIGPAVCVFGSARIPEGRAGIRAWRARSGRAIGEAGFTVITGGGPGSDGGGEPRRAGCRCAVGRSQHRAAPRAGAQPLRRPRHRVPLLLRPEADVRSLLRGLRGLPGRLRHASTSSSRRSR